MKHLKEPLILLSFLFILFALSKIHGYLHDELVGQRSGTYMTQ